MASIIAKGDVGTLKTPVISPRLFPTTAQHCKLMPSPLKKHLTWDPPSYCKAPESSNPKLNGVAVV